MKPIEPLKTMYQGSAWDVKLQELIDRVNELTEYVHNHAHIQYADEKNMEMDSEYKQSQHPPKQALANRLSWIVTHTYTPEEVVKAAKQAFREVVDGVSYVNEGGWVDQFKKTLIRKIEEL